MLKSIRLLSALLVLLFAVPVLAQPGSSDSSPQAAAVALKTFEGQFNSATKSTERFYLLSKLAPTAFIAGDLQKAKAYSNTLLQLALDFRTDWNYGNAIHIGNMVLGRIALVEGDISAAKAYLLESGKTPGSPQLDSFGPNMTLAQELLAKGERDVVLEYFKLCKTFWEMDRERLSLWASQVSGGQTPNFGANLRYGTAFPIK